MRGARWTIYRMGRGVVSLPGSCFNSNAKGKQDLYDRFKRRTCGGDVVMRCWYVVRMTRGPQVEVTLQSYVYGVLTQ